MDIKELGVAVIGSGRIGTLRASMAARHPAKKFLIVADKEKTGPKCCGKNRCRSCD